MLNNLRYQISKTHGFCIDYQPELYLSSLSDHIRILNSFPDFEPNSIFNLPSFQVTSDLTYPQLELAFLVHLMLNSAYYWQSDTPVTTIPKNLSKPTILLSKLLERPPILNLASVQYHNWKKIDQSKPFHPSNLKCIFSFSGTRDESNFYHCANYIEFLGAPALENVLKLSAATNQIADLLKNVCRSVSDMRKGLDLLINSVDPGVFYHGFRKKLRSFDKGVVFEGENIEFMSLSGASAVQSPLLRSIDASLGIIHDSEFLETVEKYMKRHHRDLLRVIRLNHSASLRNSVLKYNSTNEWNSVINELYKFRIDHIELTKKFIIKPSGLKENTGTGGSNLEKFLMDIADATKTHLL
jgi:indoleamine 2,3-dioxygenase